MSFLGRLRRAVRAIADRITGEREPSRPRRTREPDGFVSFGREGERAESRLPHGWVLVGLYHHGEQTSRLYATDDTEVTDSEIHNADALIVWYEDAGNDGYRWIHGATGWDSLSDQVDRVIIIVSPAGRGE